MDFGGASGYIFPLEGQAAILNYKNSGELGRGKKFTKHGREKEILGKGEGEGKEMLQSLELSLGLFSDISTSSL